MKTSIGICRINLVVIGLLFWTSSWGQQSAQGAPANELTALEKDAGWELLFDGETSSGWRGANKDFFPRSGWQIKDDALTVLGTNGGDIITVKKYGDFELAIEFRVKEHSANSGIKYYVLENEYKEGQTLGLEFQTSNSHPGINLITALGSVYEILPANEELVHPAEPGRWNQVRIVSKDNQVQHWLNGYKILEYTRGGDAFKKGVANSKFKEIEDFGEVAEGHILLQDHNDEVSFRNIKIREL